MPIRRSNNGSTSGGSSTMVIEMTKPESTYSSTPITSTAKPQQSTSFENLPATGAISPPAHGPTATIPQQQKWNGSRINVFRILATFYSFIILGMNDAAYGALIPYMEIYYNIDYTIISLIFLAPICGYVASALLINRIHHTLGQRGVAIMMSCSHTLAYMAICLHPPYPALVVVFIVAGFGNGLGDAGWNAWIGDMANPNEVLGFLHGFYGLGGVISPLVATAVITKYGWKWYEFYYIMVGIAAVEIVLLTTAFWKADANAYKDEHPHVPNEDESGESGTTSPVFHMQEDMQDVVPRRQPKASKLQRMNPFRNAKGATAQALKSKITMLSSIFLLVYVGIEVSIGGWIVSFMLRVRHGSPFASGLTATGFWLGITVGRLTLGFVTGRVFKSEKHAIATYLICSVAVQLMFWLIPKFVVSAVMVGILGFFLAPMFPAAIVALTKLLPKRLHVAAVGFAAAMGASGATILPFAVGAIANVAGVSALQPIILALLVVLLAIWMLVPTLPKQRTA